MCLYIYIFYGCFFYDKTTFYDKKTKPKEEFNILICSRLRLMNLHVSCIPNLRWKDKAQSSLSQVGCVRGVNTFPNHNQFLTLESLIKTSTFGFPSNPQWNTRWRLPRSNNQMNKNRHKTPHTCDRLATLLGTLWIKLCFFSDNRVLFGLHVFC